MATLISISAGEDLIEALARASSGTEGFIQASGAVDGIELRVAADGADPVRALKGRWTLASLLGPSGGPFGVTLSRASDRGIDVAAGELVRARSAGVIAALFPAQGSVPRATAAPAAPSPNPPPAQPREAPKPAAPAQSQWATAALATAASARARQAADKEDPIIPEPGDLVQHFAFGLCEVLMV